MGQTDPSPAELRTADFGRARLFGQYADEYERWRPGYPDEAVDWLLGASVRRVADVGAGTGKLTASLVARGLDVTAVEADGRMLSVLRRIVPAVTAVVGEAERLPLADASVDAILVADAWHWFEPRAAIEEVRRVLQPGGTLGVMWSVAATDGGWFEELAELDPDFAPAPVDEVPPLLAQSGLPLPELHVRRFQWDWAVTAEQVRGFLSTHSGIARMEVAQRTGRLESAERITRRACDAAGTRTIPWPHTAVCARWTPD